MFHKLNQQINQKLKQSLAAAVQQIIFIITHCNVKLLLQSRIVSGQHKHQHQGKIGGRAFVNVGFRVQG